MQNARYKAVIFDMDGTITKPVFDFQRIRKEIGLGAGDVAKEIEDMPEAERARAWRIVEEHERDAETNQELQEGAKPLLERCRADNIRVGLITRNVKRSVDSLCSKFGLSFDHVITREFEHIKPHPAPILHMLAPWRIAPVNTIMVGDYIHDIDCGKAAGTTTCFYLNPGCRDFSDHADFTVSSMQELETILWT
ncbi:MAG: HAD family hydrolase [Verrucomicrobia bacterium]|jgi:HAD superfamily hydrolase (TIGR01549 family)|nr:HAD family hydrolase [Verrucomicrobiota bacterium]